MRDLESQILNGIGGGEKEDAKRSPFAQGRTGDQPVN